MNARALLDLTADYVEARQAVNLALEADTSPDVDIDRIAQSWEEALDEYIADALPSGGA